MSGPWLGLAVCLAVYAAVASAASLAIAASAATLASRLARREPGDRARLLLALSLLPATLGLAAALGLALPAWVVYEPRGGDEHPGPVLLALAGFGALLLLARPASAALDAWRTARLVRRWRAGGSELTGLALPASCVEAGAPLAALGGLLRPRVLLSRALVEALEPDELEAVVEHERAHAEARENLRRLLLRASPDPLALLGAGQWLRVAFEEAAELEADRAACARVPPLRLARALLKTAALAPAGPLLEVAAAALHREGCVRARVHALVSAHEAGLPHPAPAPRVTPWVVAGIAAALAVPLSLGLARVHAVLESLVHLLS